MIGYNERAEYSGPSPNTMPPAPARLYSDAGVVAFRSTDGMSTETWRPASGFEGAYEVSDLGRVRGVARLDTTGRRVPPKVLVNARMSGRYLRIRLRLAGGHAEKYVHHMVLEAFVGPRPVDMHACHGDGDRWNNRLSNLRWDTASSNQRDKIAHGTMARGSRNGYASLTESQVRFIKTMLGLGVGPTTLVRAFATSRNHVQQIKRGQSWAWLSPGSVTPREREIAAALSAAAQQRKIAVHRQHIWPTPGHEVAAAAAEAGLSRALAIAVAYSEGAR